MTQYTIKTNPSEADDIYRDIKRYVIRSEKDVIKRGDIIRFQVMKERKPVYHQIAKRTYEVTMVADHMTAPITRGCKLISFKEMA